MCQDNWTVGVFSQTQTGPPSNNQFVFTLPTKYPLWRIRSLFLAYTPLNGQTVKATMLSIKIASGVIFQIPLGASGGASAAFSLWPSSSWFGANGGTLPAIPTGDSPTVVAGLPDLMLDQNTQIIVDAGTTAFTSSDQITINLEYEYPPTC
jgi:hypothetical protein